jgi:2-polyprenyl-3-methyl-5-hydroxy-6-metoxy-1,4-benzoquinol methylase
MMDASEHNTVSASDKRYSDVNWVFDYLAHGRFEWYGDVIRLFVSRAGIDFAGKSVADIGCGLGVALRYISYNYGADNLWGFDYSKEALKWARRVLPSATFKKHDIEKPLNMKFDVIISLEVLEHLHKPELGYKNMMDTLVDGGTAFLTVPDAKLDSFGGHINHWTLEEFREFTGAKHMGQLDDMLLAIVVREES